MQQGLRALYRLTKRTEPPKETASERMAMFLRMVVALAGLEEIAFAFYYLMIPVLGNSSGGKQCLID